MGRLVTTDDELSPSGHLQVIGRSRTAQVAGVLVGRRRQALARARAGLGAEVGQEDRPRRRDLARGGRPEADGSYLPPKEAEAELRRILEHEAAKRPTMCGGGRRVVTFADAAEA